jgi:uncharacterized protein (DUF697 family)
MSAAEDEFSRVSDAINKLLQYIDKLPGGVRQRVIAELQPLLRFLENGRYPRVMLVGRRGSGKSSIVNALFGAKAQELGHVHTQTGHAQWRTFEYRGRRMEILDTRGVQEGSRPAEDDLAGTAEASLLDAIRSKCPDVILFIIKARDVDTAIDGDLAALEAVLREAERTNGTTPHILPVLTHCDELHPVHIPLGEMTSSDPDQNAAASEKATNIALAAQLLQRHLRSRSSLADFVSPTTVPTCAYLYFGKQGQVEHDGRWNIDQLALAMCDHLPDETLLQFSRLVQFRVVQRAVAKKVIPIFVAAAAAAAAEPLPVADIVVITSLQAGMIIIIAYISGRQLSSESVADFARGLGANVAAGFVLREIARALVKLLPVAGSFISAGIAAGGTKLVGEAAIAYYIEARPMDVVYKEFKDKMDDL